MIKHYELMFIVPGAIEETQVPTVKQRVQALLEQVKATVTFEEDMGRRRLAYPINHETHGHYFVMEFDAEATVLKDFNRQLQLDTEVLRFLIVSLKARPTEELQRLADARKQRQVEHEALQKARAEKEQAKLAPIPEVEEVVLADAAEETKQVSMEELDKKLDAILDDKDIELKL